MTIFSEKCLFQLDVYLVSCPAQPINFESTYNSFDTMITLIFTISGEYFDMIDQDTNGEIDGQEATDAINYMIENDLMTDSK